jgi:hypothetical protein
MSNEEKIKSLTWKYFAEQKKKEIRAFLEPVCLAAIIIGITLLVSFGFWALGKFVIPGVAQGCRAYGNWYDSTPKLQTTLYLPVTYDTIPTNMCYFAWGFGTIFALLSLVFGFIYYP